MYNAYLMLRECYPQCFNCKVDYNVRSATESSMHHIVKLAIDLKGKIPIQALKHWIYQCLVLPARG